MRTALIVIDVQRGLFEPEPRPFEAARVVERIDGLAERARAQGVPVIWVQHEREETPLAHGTDGWQLARGLRTVAGDQYVRKTTPDAFLRTNLQDVLDSFGVRHVVLCGYACEFCVDTTTRRAAALGYAVTLASDAHTTHDKPHAAASAIRAHENATLPDIVSFGPPIEAVPSEGIFSWKP